MNHKSNRALAAQAYNRKQAASEETEEIDFDAKIQEIVTNLLGLSKSEIHTVSFVSFLIFECEKKITGAIQKAMKTTSGKYNDDIFSVVLDKLSFGQKIDVYKGLLKQYPEVYQDLLKGMSFFGEMNRIRNELFHAKIKDIRYKKHPVLELSVRLRMIGDYLKAIGLDIPKNK